MQFLDIRQLKDKISPEEKIIKIKNGDNEQRIMLLHQKTGFGQRRFFQCPRCSKRVERLYFKDDRWRCAKCSGVNPYRGIQNNTKGGYEEIAYRMKRYAEKNGISFDFPFDYLNFVLDERNRKESFRKHIRVLQALENMRFHSLMFGAKYDPKDFQVVISGQHPLIKSKTLYDLKEYVYDWSKNEQVELKEWITSKDAMKEV